jgi:AraC family transcriptional regulator, glycine betaine-responsive activator
VTRTSTPQQIAILLLDQFSVISFSCTVEPLREANWVLKKKVYDWRMYSKDGKPVLASNGLSVNVHGSIEDLDSCPMVIVCSSFDPHLYATRRVISWLKKLARQGTILGSVETGSWVLAKAGLLNGYRATIHWENRASIAEVYPEVILTDNIFEIDRDRFSASGATPAMDMMLHFISKQHGVAAASAVAEQFIYNRIRASQAPQRLSTTQKYGLRHPKLRRLTEMLDSQLERRIDVQELARISGLSARQVHRLFKAHLGVSPQTYHRQLRLRRARDMLRQTELTVLEIAMASGFTSSSDFARVYRRTFHQSPHQDRAAVYALDSL